jgi:hypothetical protein
MATWRPEFGDDKGGAQCDLGLAEAHVAADHAVHRLGRGEIGQHGIDGGLLIFGFLVFESGGETCVQTTLDLDTLTLPGRTSGLQIEQFGGDIAHFLGRLAPGLRAQLVRTEACAGRPHRDRHRCSG